MGRLPYLIALRTKISKGRQVCGSSLNNAFNNENSREIYYTFLLVTFYALPWLAIFSFYTTIVTILKTGKTAPRQERMITAMRLNRTRGKATRNVIKMMLIITLVFLVCWIAYFLAQLAFSKVPCSFRFWRLFMAHCNCAINPVLFAIFNTTLRRGVKDIARKSRSFYNWANFPRSTLRQNTLNRRNIYIFPKRPINESMNMTNFSRAIRKGVSRRKVGEVELGIMNGGIQKNSINTTAVLSFKTLEKK